MELFGIGIFEILLIVLIALIFLGPQDTVRAGRNLGRAVRRFFSSEEWRTLLQTSREIRTIPDKLLEETGLDPEDILPSEAEIREEAGLDDLAQNMVEWKADLNTMKKTGQAPGETQLGEILPPRQVVRREAGLEDVERDLSEWKADLSAWGNSPVIIPTPQPATAAGGQVPAAAASEPASAPAESQPAAESVETETPSPDGSESEPTGQEAVSADPSEQEKA
jgi:Sec-independent protein translocase protein TatA